MEHTFLVTPLAQLPTVWSGTKDGAAICSLDNKDHNVSSNKTVIKNICIHELIPYCPLLSRTVPYLNLTVT